MVGMRPGSGVIFFLSMPKPENLANSVCFRHLCGTGKLPAVAVCFFFGGSELRLEEPSRKQKAPPTPKITGQFPFNGSVQRCNDFRTVIICGSFERWKKCNLQKSNLLSALYPSLLWFALFFHGCFLRACPLPEKVPKRKGGREVFSGYHKSVLGKFGAKDTAKRDLKKKLSNTIQTLSLTFLKISCLVNETNAEV